MFRAPKLCWLNIFGDVLVSRGAAVQRNNFCGLFTLALAPKGTSLSCLDRVFPGETSSGSTLASDQGGIFSAVCDYVCFSVFRFTVVYLSQR